MTEDLFLLFYYNIELYGEAFSRSLSIKYAIFLKLFSYYKINWAFRIKFINNKF